jgi:CubicO group peptidase (beta-lactamase class C family)
MAERGINREKDSCLKMRVFISIVAVSVLTTSAPSQAVDNETDKPKEITTFAELKDRIIELLEDHNIPGASIAIVSSDSILCQAGLGYADYERGLLVDENTHFRLGSIAKSFTALGILKLVEEGRIDLRDPVRRIVPDVNIENPWRDTDPVRIVHLLEHTAGFNDTLFNDYYLNGDPDYPLKEGLKVSANCLKVRWRPGKWNSYSSVGFAVAGCIIEEVTGERYEDYLNRVVFEPVGMATSSIGLTAASSRLLAQGYGSDYTPTPYWRSYTRPAGELNSSAREMARFLQFMLNRGSVNEEQVFRAATIDRMESSMTDPGVKAGLSTGKGLGIGIGYYRGFRFFSHLGATAGFAGAYTYSREIDRGCVLLTNRYDMDFVTGVTALWSELREFMMSDIERREIPVPPVHPIPPGELARFTGWYQLRSQRQEVIAWLEQLLNYVEIKAEGDTLYNGDPLFGGYWTPLIPVTSATFRSEAGKRASAAFFSTDDGTMAFVSGGSCYERIASWKAWLYRIAFFLAWLIMISTVVYAVAWIPIDMFKRVKRRENRCPYLRMRIAPLLAISIFILSIIFVARQPLMDWGQRTAPNIALYAATWIFAALAFCSLYFALQSFGKPVRVPARIYTLIVALSLVGMTLYLGYHGVIGLRLWAY